MAITTTTLATGSTNVAYSTTLASSGGTAPVSWDVASGALPTGITLASNGVLSGTTSASGSFSFTARVTDAASQSVTTALILQISLALSVDAVTLNPATVNQAYSTAITASGGVSPYSWSITSGTLPAGVTFGSSGVLSGTPTAYGTFNFVVSVADSSGQTATRSMSLVVQPPALVITTSSLPNAITALAYSYALARTGGIPPYTWTVTMPKFGSSNLPPGITLSTSGVLSGTSTTGGQYGVTVRLSDSAGSNTTANFTLTVTPVFRITNNLVLGGIQSLSYSLQLQTADGVSPYTWSISAGALPPGLSLGTNIGLLSGIPTTAGTFNFTIQVVDSGSHTATMAVLMVISPSNPQYGNLGDAYADEGGAPNPSAILLNACGSLSGGKSYRLSANLNAANLSTVCITFPFFAQNTKLDLGGFTVNGRIYMNGNPNGVSIFNGTVNCLWNDNGGDAGCVRIEADGITPTAQFRVHHLSIYNTGNLNTRSLHIGYGSPTPPARTAFTLRVYNITSVVPAQPTSNRAYAIAYLGNQVVEMSGNDLTCSADTAACQGMMCYGATDCKIHGNRGTLILNTTGQDGRLALWDGNTANGEGWNNTVTCTNNRCLRVRDSYNIDLHDNTLLNIMFQGVGLGDPALVHDDDLNVVVERNSFQINGGIGVFLRDAFDAVVQNNTVTCTGSCTGLFAQAREPATGGVSILTLLNNPTVTVLTSPQVQSDSRAVINICNSGTAGPGPLGLGTVNIVSCPP